MDWTQLQRQTDGEGHSCISPKLFVWEREGGIILYRQPNTYHGMHFLMMSVTQSSKTNHFEHLKIKDGYHCC